MLIGATSFLIHGCISLLSRLNIFLVIELVPVDAKGALSCYKGKHSLVSCTHVVDEGVGIRLLGAPHHHLLLDHHCSLANRRLNLQ